MLENFIMCPKCEDTLVKINEQSYSCNSCKVEFPNYNGIIDLRNLSSDNTKGFSLEKDFAIGQILLKNFAKFENYNGLKFMYEKIAEYFEEASYDYKPISNHEISKILDLSREHDLPMSESQSIHGYDILKKINLYLKEFNYDPYPNNICVENGGGLGSFLEGLSKNFKNTIFIDFSFAYTVLAKKLCEEKKLLNVYLLCANVEKLPIKSKSIDLIHSNNVIEHVTNQNKMISEISRTLSSKGLLFLLSPNKFSAYFEPHFTFPFYGFIPFKLRKWLIYKMQKRDCREVSLLGFKELKDIFKANFSGYFQITFLPSKLKRAAQAGYLRKIIIFFFYLT